MEKRLDLFRCQTRFYRLQLIYYPRIINCPSYYDKTDDADGKEVVEIDPRLLAEDEMAPATVVETTSSKPTFAVRMENSRF